MNIAIIPARGGSKRIPRKNIRIFNGRPLISYSIEAAKISGLFDDIVVSTDDGEIAEVARDCGASVPFVRPANLSDDYSTTGEVVKHAVDWMSQQGIQYDFVCTIYATAPFLNPKYLVSGLNALQESSAQHTFSATSSPYPSQRMFKINEAGRCEMFFPEKFSVRSQDLEESFHDAGQFYWSRWMSNDDSPILGESSIPIILPRYLVQDIDTMEDWVRAELMHKVLLQNNEL